VLAARLLSAPFDAGTARVTLSAGAALGSKAGQITPLDAGRLKVSGVV